MAVCFLSFLISHWNKRTVDREVIGPNGVQSQELPHPLSSSKLLPFGPNSFYFPPKTTAAQTKILPLRVSTFERVKFQLRPVMSRDCSEMTVGY